MTTAATCHFVPSYILFNNKATTRHLDRESLSLAQNTFRAGISVTRVQNEVGQLRGPRDSNRGSDSSGPESAAGRSRPSRSLFSYLQPHQTLISQILLNTSPLPFSELSTTPPIMADKVLLNEFKSLSKETWTNISLIQDNIFEWSVALIVLNPDSLYYGGYFKARMTFPRNYPYEPPDFRFERPLWHPNVYTNGKLCISILHQPGEDAMSGELAGERWSPVQRVESVLISVLSLLDDAECSSPANVDAGVQLRKDPEGYKKRVAEDRERSKQDIPEGFEMPTHETAFQTQEKSTDDFSWSDSEAGDDFDDSDEDEEMFDDDEGTDEEDDEE